MSSCTMRIELHHPQREIRGGDNVRGTAHVTVNQDTNCKEVRIEYFWKTHGRGDVDRGAIGSQQLVAGRRLVAGEYIKVPFSFLAPCDPLSYRGRMLNVDHYVQLIVDIPWGTNLSIEEEFMVLPGRRPDYLPVRRDQVALDRPATTITLGWFGKAVAVVVIGLLSVALILMASLIIPFVIVGGAIYLVHRYLVRSRVGDVTLQVPHKLICPGEPFPVAISFTPKWNLKIDGVFVTILGQEHCETGSGTDKRTYRETVYQERFPLTESQTLTAGQLVTLSIAPTLPRTKAYSFKASDNQVKWTAEIRISIPRWPDWVDTQTLQMVPQEFLEDVPTDGLSGIQDIQPPSVQAEEIVPSTDWKSDTTRSDGSDLEASFQEAATPGQPNDLSYANEGDASGTSDQAAEMSVDDEQPVATAETVHEVLNEVMSAERVTSARQAVIDLYQDRIFAAEVKIERTYSTYGQDDDRYNDGRTVIGNLSGTQHSVRLFLLARPDEQVERLAEGSLWQGDVRILHWDGLYQRADLFEE